MRTFKNFDTFEHGQVIITAAGTPKQLPGIAVPDGVEVKVIAAPANTGYIYFGKSSAACANASGRFDGLSAGLAAAFRVTNTSSIWVDTSVSGEWVSYYFEVA